MLEKVKLYLCYGFPSLRVSAINMFSFLKVNWKGVLFYEILMDCVARKRMQKTTSSYLKWFPRYCDLNFYLLSH